MSEARRVIVEADGASRGNPGPASYGALLRDAATGAVIAEDGRALGEATNNVAEYTGLVAGLQLARDHAPGAAVEVRMDSKLVVEQMSGRWKIKNADLAVIARKAKAVEPSNTTYVWVPRERNGAADALANAALDGTRSGVTVSQAGVAPVGSGNIESPAAGAPTKPAVSQSRGWSGSDTAPTTLILVRHGVTAMTVDKRFSGGLAGSNPGLSDEGREQAGAAGRWLLPLAERIDDVISSPVRRTVESAEIVADTLGRTLEEHPAFAEMEFGRWDGLSFAEVADRYAGEMKEWFGSLDAAPHGGESFRSVEQRVMAGLDQLISEREGHTIVLVSHVTPIKILVAQALGAPLDAVYRMELSPASVSAVSYYRGGHDGTERVSSLRLFNGLPGDPPIRL